MAGVYSVQVHISYCITFLTGPPASNSHLNFSINFIIRSWQMSFTNVTSQGWEELQL